MRPLSEVPNALDGRSVQTSCAFPLVVELEVELLVTPLLEKIRLSTALPLEKEMMRGLDRASPRG
jgi:hypothetical protein